MKRPNILIVEDEPAILRALEHVFTREGFEVFTAENGKKGVTASLNRHPDIILFDIMMPVMDGMSMLKAIRETGGKWGKGARAIVYSNLSYNEKREEAERLRVVDFLVKANTPLSDVVQKAREVLKRPAVAA